MIKYFHFARIAFVDHLSNRLRLSTRFVVFMLLVWIMGAMWTVIYKTGHGPASITSTEMIWYMAVGQMMFFLSPRLFVIIDDDVRSGNIGYFINRPIPYLWMRFAEGVGAMSGNFVILTTLGTLAITLYAGADPPCGWLRLGIIYALIFMSSVLHLLIQIGCGLSTFWTNDAVFIYHSYQKCLLLLGGVYIPLSLYPEQFGASVLPYLPFASLVGNPVSLFFSNFTMPLLEIVGLQFLWLIAVVFALTQIFKVCLRKVEVNGG